MRVTSVVYDRVPWEQLKRRLKAEWVQAQHGLVCAPTGRGKTVLIQELLEFRSHVAFFGTKVFDEEYDRMINQRGYHRIERWPPPHPGFQEKVMLWPRPGETISETQAIQRRAFRLALDKIFRTGKWTVCLDELHWMAKDLGLYSEIASMHHQGRSSGLTLIDGFQRPAFVPVIVYSSATHIFLWGTNYREDLRKVSSVAKIDALNPVQLRETMGSLGEHEFVYVNVRDNRPPIISQVKR